MSDVINATVCVMHRMSSITPLSFHAVFALEEEAFEFMKTEPPMGSFAAFKVPYGCTWQRLGEICNKVWGTGKLPRGVKWI